MCSAMCQLCNGTTYQQYTTSPASARPYQKILMAAVYVAYLSGATRRSVERPVEGMVFHYPCYFAPPMSVIRVGDYKYMKHLLTGETQLFNLKSDYSEKFNLAREMPEKAAELDKVLSDYLVSIDAEDVQDVYQGSPGRARSF
jgi:hypothetical protein